MNPFQNPLSTPLFSARIPFKPMLLAGTLSLLLAACGGGSDAGSVGGFFPPVAATPPAVQPEPESAPQPQPEPDQLVSQARFTPNAGTTEGSSDASTALALPDNFM